MLVIRSALMKLGTHTIQITLQRGSCIFFFWKYYRASALYSNRIFARVLCFVSIILVSYGLHCIVRTGLFYLGLALQKSVANAATRLLE